MKPTLLIQDMENELHKRLGKWIFGTDEETLEMVAMMRIAALGWKLCVVEAGLDGRLIRRLAQVGKPFVGGEMLTTNPSKNELSSLIMDSCTSKQAQVGLGIILEPGETQQTLHIAVISPKTDRLITRDLRWTSPACTHLGHQYMPGLNQKFIRRRKPFLCQNIRRVDKFPIK